MRPKLALLLVLAVVVACVEPAAAQSPFAYLKPFDVPTADGATVKCQFLPGPNSAAWLQREGSLQILTVVPVNTVPTPAPTPTPTPVPTPQPTPVPTPTPTPEPITVGPISVLFLYESGDLAKMGVEQSGIIASMPIREYLAAKAAKDAKGNLEALFLDTTYLNPDKLPADLRKFYDEANKLPKPAVMLSNGKNVYRGQWAKNAAEQLTILKKYGG